jgi:copper(I)-binding protein
MRPFISVLALLAALAGCDFGTRTVVTIDEPWIRLAAVPGQPAAGYATVSASANRGDLTGISSPRAKRVEMHETMTHGSMTGMRPVERIGTGEPIVFAPGGRHLMLFGLDPSVRAGGKADLVFHFEHGDPVTTIATVVAAGDPPPFQ